jgi:hypothetical protein
MEFTLKHGETCILDDIDSDLIDYNWIKGKSSKYARKSIKNLAKWETVYLHKIIIKRMNIEIPDGWLVDHIDRNKLNNSRSNLRVATNRQNSINKNLKPNEVRYRGVYKHYDKYIAQITLNSKVTHLGRYNNKEDAAVAFNNAAIKYYGDFAVLNEIK